MLAGCVPLVTSGIWAMSCHYVKALRMQEVWADAPQVPALVVAGTLCKIRVGLANIE